MAGDLACEVAACVPGDPPVPQAVGRVQIVDKDQRPDLEDSLDDQRFGLAQTTLAQAVDLRSNPGLVEAHVAEDVGRDAGALAEQPEQEVFGADGVAAHFLSLVEGQLDGAFHSGGGDDLRDCESGALAEHRPHLGPDVVRVDADAPEDLGAETVGLTENAEQQVLGSNIALAGLLGLFLGVCECLFGGAAEAVEGVDGARFLDLKVVRFRGDAHDLPGLSA